MVIEELFAVLEFFLIAHILFINLVLFLLINDTLNILFIIDGWLNNMLLMLRLLSSCFGCLSRNLLDSWNIWCPKCLLSCIDFGHLWFFFLYRIYFWYQLTKKFSILMYSRHSLKISIVDFNFTIRIIWLFYYWIYIIIFACHILVIEIIINIYILSPEKPICLLIICFINKPYRTMTP